MNDSKNSTRTAAKIAVVIFKTFELGNPLPMDRYENSATGTCIKCIPVLRQSLNKLGNGGRKGLQMYIEAASCQNNNDADVSKRSAIATTQVRWV